MYISVPDNYIKVKKERVDEKKNKNGLILEIVLRLILSFLSVGTEKELTFTLHRTEKGHSYYNRHLKSIKGSSRSPSPLKEV